MIEERVYTPDSDLRHPLVFLRQMLRDAWAGRYLAWRIFLRDINARYRQTALGFLWLLIPPVAAAVALTAANKAEVIRVARTDLPYPVYVLFSMALWQTFTDALTAPLQAIYDARSVLSRINFPREALMLARLGDASVGFVVRLLLVLAAFLWFGVSLPASAWLALPAACAVILFGFSVGVLLAPLATLYQDILKSITIVLGFWLFLSPVLYPVPQGGGAMATVVKWNPVTALLVTVRELATGASLSMPGAYLLIVLASLVVTLLAWVAYRLALPYVVERLSA